MSHSFIWAENLFEFWQQQMTPLNFIFISEREACLCLVSIWNCVPILELTIWNFLHRNRSALSRQPHTCWRTWSPSLLILSGWLPVVNMELELTPMRSLQKLHRHVGPLPYLTEFKLFGKEHIFKCISNFYVRCRIQKVTKLSGKVLSTDKANKIFLSWVHAFENM